MEKTYKNVKEVVDWLINIEVLTLKEGLKILKRIKLKEK